MNQWRDPTGMVFMDRIGKFDKGLQLPPCKNLFDPEVYIWQSIHRTSWSGIYNVKFRLKNGGA